MRINRHLEFVEYADSYHAAGLHLYFTPNKNGGEFFAVCAQTGELYTRNIPAGYKNVKLELLKVIN